MYLNMEEIGICNYWGGRGTIIFQYQI